MLKKLLLSFLSLIPSIVVANSNPIISYVPAPINQSSGTITTFTAGTITDTGLASGNCLQSGTGGVISTASGACLSLGALSANAPLSYSGGTGLISLSGIVPVANGGTGTGSPGLVAGTNINISGTWPNNTIATTASSVYPASATASFPNGFSASTATIGGATFAAGASGLVSLGGNLNVSGSLALPLAANQCLQTNGAGTVITSGGSCGGGGGSGGGSVAFLYNGTPITSPTVSVVVDTSTLNYTIYSGALSSGTLAVNQNLTISTLTLSGTGPAAFNMTEGAATSVTGVSSSHDVCWADSTNHALTCDFNNSGSSGTVVLSTTTDTAGHCAYWTAQGTVGDLGAACGTGSGGSGGGGSGTITAAAQYEIPYYSLSGSTTTLAGSANFTNTGTSVTFNSVSVVTESGLTSETASGVLFTYTGSTMTLSSGTINNLQVSTLAVVNELSTTGGQVMMSGFNASGNFYAGYSAGQGAGNSGNTGIGYAALQGATGTSNTSVGPANLVNCTGQFNTAIGADDIFYGSLSGNDNTAVGANQFVNTGTIAADNTTIGYNIFTLGTTAQRNTVVGSNAFVNGTFASSNTIVGYGGAYGTDLSSSPANLQGDTFIGYEAGVSTIPTSGPITKSLALGYGAVVGSSNTAVIATQNLSIQGNAVPVVSSCGSSPSNVGSDSAGTITVGSGVTTSCTLTFSTPWLATPTCIESDNSTTVTGDISSVSTTAITFGFSASLGSGQVYYICIGSK